MVKLKPDGKARICINMSAPYGKPGDPEGIPKAVNEGIDADEFLATMSSTRSFCESLMLAGCPGVMCKLDWREAYKHTAVREEDHKLQVFEFGGRLFGEIMETFGCVSSAGIFDDVSKVVKGLAIIKSDIWRKMVNQVLDDAVACGGKGEKVVARFYLCYRQICDELGVKLAGEEDADKAFGLRTAARFWG